MNRDTVRQISVLLAVIVTIAVNTLANTLPINGQTTGEISDRYPALFVPAGYVFSIWGLIYLGLAAYGLYQALPAQRDNPRLRRIGWLFVLSCLANCVWIVLWHYEQLALTVLVMLALLALLIAIYLRLDIGRARPRGVERWVADLPFSIYLGWVSVATVANIASALVGAGLDGAGVLQQVSTVIMLLVAAALAAAMGFLRRDAAFMGVVVWALAGIAVRQSAVPLVAGAAWVLAGVVLLLLLGSSLTARKRQLVNW